jgi:hypothetical protein
MARWSGLREEGQHGKSSVSFKEENQASKGMNGRVVTWFIIRVLLGVRFCVL